MTIEFHCGSVEESRMVFIVLYQIQRSTYVEVVHRREICGVSSFLKDHLFKISGINLNLTLELSISWTSYHYKIRSLYNVSSALWIHQIDRAYFLRNLYQAGSIFSISADLIYRAHVAVRRYLILRACHYIISSWVFLPDTKVQSHAWSNSDDPRW